MLFGLLLISSIRVFGAQISTDYDHSTNFAQYKTYSWLKVQAGDSLWEDRIKQDIDAQLSAKGWTKVAGDGMATTTTDVTKIGTLVVDIFDSQTQKLIWRGKQSDALSGNPDKNEKKLAKDLAGMFKHFPPSH